MFNLKALPFRSAVVAIAFITGIITSFTIFAQTTSEAQYDRLDGTGESGKKVDVIEWEGNLEIHVYPQGSVAGLGAKLDDRDPGKKVMVIGYRFNEYEPILVRRAILGVPFTAQIKGFKDPTAKGYDKLAFSNKILPKPWVPYKLDPAPKQWYPDGDERNENDPALKAKRAVPVITEQKPNPENEFKLNSEQSGPTPVRVIPSTRKPAQTAAPHSDGVDSEKPEAEEKIQHFSW